MQYVKMQATTCNMQAATCNVQEAIRNMQHAKCQPTLQVGEGKMQDARCKLSNIRIVPYMFNKEQFNVVVTWLRMRVCTFSLHHNANSTQRT